MSQFRKDESLHPTEGARFLYERESVSADQRQAAYRAAIYTPEKRFEYSAAMDLDGSVEVSVRGESAGEELEVKLQAIGRILARAAAKRLAGDMPPWPHRVLRWRGPGRG